MYPFNQYPKFSMYMLVSSTLVEMLKEHEDRRLFYYAEPAQTLLSPERMHTRLMKAWTRWPRVRRS